MRTVSSMAHDNANNTAKNVTAVANCVLNTATGGINVYHI